MIEAASSYWYARLLFERSLAFIYLVAFLGAANQFVPLAGEHGLLPFTWVRRAARFRGAPTVFAAWPHDTVLRAAAWLGVILAALTLAGETDGSTLASAATWTTMWVLYLSFVNAGPVFYGWAWESLLLEAGFVTIVAGGAHTVPNGLVIAMWRWMLFRVMFGAGIVKLDGDTCWRSLTCLDYYFETQPMPHALSWYCHWLPKPVHRVGTAASHVCELVVPFLYFAPQPFAAVGGLITIAFQLTIIAGGNVAWFNWLTIALCIPTIDDRWWSWLPAVPGALHEPAAAVRVIVAIVAFATLVVSVPAIRHMLSHREKMNAGFNPLRFVNSYGMFRFIARSRSEIIIEGAEDAVLSPETAWREYEFKGKPGNPSRRPPIGAPYLFRLDLAIWSAGMSLIPHQVWFPRLLAKLLEGDRATLRLLRRNPFPNDPPRWVQAVEYEYRFTTPEERRRTGDWWCRRRTGVFMPPVCPATFDPVSGPGSIDTKEPV